MANTVRDGEAPGLTITDGSKKYLCYPDYGVQSESEAGWAINLIDSSDENKTVDKWANGKKVKIFKASLRASYTYKNLI